MLFNINDLCRKFNRGFIYTGLLSYFGFLFLDYGSKFEILDKDGKTEDSIFIKSIQKKSPYTYTIDLFEYDEDIILKKNMFIQLKKISHLPLFNDQKFKIINIIDKKKIEIDVNFCQDDPNCFVCSEGVAVILKETEICEFSTLENALLNPKFMKLDYANFKKEASLHLVLNTFLEFHDRYKKFPSIKDIPLLNEIAEALNLVNICKEFGNEDIRLNYFSDFDNNFINLAVAKGNFDFPPLGTIFGAMVSQEILKFTKKFTPLKSWFFYDIYEMIKHAHENSLNNGDDQFQANNLYEFMLGKKFMDLIQMKKYILFSFDVNKLFNQPFPNRMWGTWL